MTGLTGRTAISPLMLALLAVLAASVAGQVVGASQDQSGLSIFAAAAFTGALLRVAWQINRPWWRPDTHAIGPALTTAQPMMAVRNARLIAAGYGWGASSLLAVYLLSGLHWQHGWQYGGGMLLIAGLIVWLTQGLEARWSPSLARALAWSAIVHSWAATFGIGWLIAMGKIFSSKGDWAANVVFAAGAFCIVGLSLLALRTARALETRA